MWWRKTKIPIYRSANRSAAAQRSPRVHEDARAVSNGTEASYQRLGRPSHLHRRNRCRPELKKPWKTCFTTD